jgi:hypothetical protein
VRAPPPAAPPPPATAAVNATRTSSSPIAGAMHAAPYPGTTSVPAEVPASAGGAAELLAMQPKIVPTRSRAALLEGDLDISENYKSLESPRSDAGDPFFVHEDLGTVEGGSNKATAAADQANTPGAGRNAGMVPEIMKRLRSVGIYGHGKGDGRVQGDCAAGGPLTKDQAQGVVGSAHAAATAATEASDKEVNDRAESGITSPRAGRAFVAVQQHSMHFLQRTGISLRTKPWQLSAVIAAAMLLLLLLTVTTFASVRLLIDHQGMITVQRVQLAAHADDLAALQKGMEESAAALAVLPEIQAMIRDEAGARHKELDSLRQAQAVTTASLAHLQSSMRALVNATRPQGAVQQGGIDSNSNNSDYAPLAPAAMAAAARKAVAQQLAELLTPTDLALADCGGRLLWHSPMQPQLQQLPPLSSSSLLERGLVGAAASLLRLTATPHAGESAAALLRPTTPGVCLSTSTPASGGGAAWLEVALPARAHVRSVTLHALSQAAVRRDGVAGDSSDGDSTAPPAGVVDVTLALANASACGGHGRGAADGICSAANQQQQQQEVYTPGAALLASGSCGLQLQPVELPLDAGGLKPHARAVIPVTAASLMATAACVGGEATGTTGTAGGAAAAGALATQGVIADRVVLMLAPRAGSSVCLQRVSVQGVPLDVSTW